MSALNGDIYSCFTARSGKHEKHLPLHLRHHSTLRRAAAITGFVNNTCCTTSVQLVDVYRVFKKAFNRFTWFNIGKITKNDRCLIKTIKTENIMHTHNMT